MNQTLQITLYCVGIFLTSYLIGSVPFGYLIGRLNGLDIRLRGSHNIGATNVSRVLGKDWGYTCFVLDFLKGYLPVLYIGQMVAKSYGVPAELGVLLSAIGTVCGHIFPVWLKFKGGKGVATSLGVVCGLAFIPLICGLVAWLLFYYICHRIVSIASMAAVCAMAIAGVVMAIMGAVHYSIAGLLVGLAILVIVRHKDNIKRLINGNENSFVKVPSKKP